MAWSKFNWLENVTQAVAARFNNEEEGIEESKAAAAAAQTTASEAKTAALARTTKGEAETIAGEAVKKTELPAATAVAIANIASLSGIPAKGETDEVTLAEGNIVLCPNQTTASARGPWEVKTGAWVRPTGFSHGSEQLGAFIGVALGATHAGSLWVMTNVTKVTVDTTAQTWVENSQGSGIVARKEESLGEKSGGVSLDLSKATVFRATITGTTAFTFINAPVYPVEVELLVTQDATGGRKWSVEGVSWVGPVPYFVLAAKELVAVNLFIAESGKQILASGGLLGVTSAPVAAKELKENTSIEPSATATTTVYLSVLAKAEETVGEVIVDGASTYKIRKETLTASSDNMHFSFRLKAGAQFEVKMTTGKIETSTTAASVYTFQEG